MTVKRAITTVLRVLFFIVLALALLASGAVSLFYSPWAQEQARKAIVARFGNMPGGTSVSLDAFRLRFPLKLELEGLALKESSDTLVAARTLRADVALLPLLAGRAKVSEAVMTGARYRIGTPDSVMYLTIAADSIRLSPASVRLTTMDIDLGQGFIGGGELGIFLRPDTSSQSTPPTEPTRMAISLGELVMDDFTYAMRLMPTIDTLRAEIRQGAMRNGKVDLYNQKISLGSFTGTQLDARYITPDSAAIAEAGPYPAASESDSTSSAPWTVAIDSISFDRSHALYATSGAEPLPGLDFAYIEVADVTLSLHDFYNRETTVKLPLHISGTERCGVTLDAKGLLDINATELNFKDFTLSTPEGTQAAFSGILGSGDMATDPSLPLGITLEGEFAPTDLSRMFPAFMPYFAAIPRAEDIQLNIDASGTTGNLTISELALKLNGCVNLTAEGNIRNMMQPDNLGGHLELNGNILNVTPFKNAALDPATAKTIAIPPMNLQGNIDMTGGTVNGRLAARTKGGDLRLNGRWNSRREAYTASLSTRSFPVNAFMPLLGVGAVTAELKADGRGYNPFLKSTNIDASLNLSQVEYAGVTYSDIKGTARLADGHADISLDSYNPNADLSLSASGNLDGKVYSWTARIDGRNVDLLALKFSTTPATIEVVAGAEAEIGPGKNDIKARLTVDDLFFRQLSGTIAVSDVDVHLNGTDSLTDLKLTNRDMTASFTSPAALDSITARFGRASEVMSHQISAYSINVDSLCRELPPFALDVNAGSSNLINDILAPSKMSLKSFHLTADNDSSLTMNARIIRLATETMRLDSLYLNARQHDEHLHLSAGIENKPGNMDAWHKVNIQGRVDGNRLALLFKQQNNKGATGFDIGLSAHATAADSTISLSINPFEPVIGYQNWNVNDDNFISYRFPDRHIDANLHMTGGNSSLAIYTEHPVAVDSLAEHSQEDLVIKLGDIHIQDWIALNPFAPPVKGDINADMRLNRRDDMLVGKGSAGISNFTYGRDRVADFTADFDVSAGAGGLIHANADLLVDGVKTITARGVLNDSTATTPLGLDLRMIHFPLATANPFLPDGMARLSGTLNGKMDITGTTDRPVINGALAFDSTAVYLKMTGTSYRFSPDSVAVRNSVVNFNNFTIDGCNENPLRINGTVDLKDMSNMKLNLGLKADNMQIVNSNRASRGADVYGKAYIGLDAKASGSMQLMSVAAKLRLLSGTNVTYIIPDATSAIANYSSSDVVKFVNFADSSAVAKADSIVQSGMAMFLDAQLTIEDGTIVTVDLAPTGNNKVQLQSNGTLTYTMTPLSSGRLVGRLNIDNGFIRYSPPVIGEKSFSFQNGSYVAFTGDMMNPTLHVNAVDVIKTNVTLEGQNSRMVNFDVTVAVTGTLEQMNVVFDVSTIDDISVANELSAMSPEQRASQAMNLLLYGMYMGPGAQNNNGLSPNALYSFLESQINNWAANTIKGVDISFGIDQYDRTVDGATSSAMTYSYQVSKSLFNDRFKIVVGGNYSTDANNDENFSQNLINDISFEYFLNAARTMYLRLFRHTGYESILEGEITQTGVGFVYRRKLRRLGDMFLPHSVVKRREEKAALEESGHPSEQQTEESK